MAGPSPTLIYVHGAGAQPPAADWLQIHNQILFPDGTGLATEIAYYADLMRRDDEAGVDPSLAPESPVIRSADPDQGELVTHHSVAGQGRTHEAQLFLLRLAAAMGPTDHRSRFALPSHVIPPAVRNFYREVTGYLHGTPGLADAMRDRVRTAIDRQDGPVVVLAHSLGSIVAFDVLSEPGLAGRDVSFITVGSPLGLGPTQDHLLAWRGTRPIEIPVALRSWRNFQAAGDPVAVGSGLEDLRNDYAPALRVHSTAVRNEAEWHHALNGYLETPEVRDAVYARLWGRGERPGVPA